MIFHAIKKMRPILLVLKNEKVIADFYQFIDDREQNIITLQSNSNQNKKFTIVKVCARHINLQNKL